MPSISARNDADFPAKQLAVLALCRLAEPIAFTSILAYSFVMVQQLNETDRDASFYSGLLVSAFAIAETSTVMFWGMLSDHVGRKPIVLLGLVGTAVSSLLFGFATKYWMALAARLLGGLLNGNVAVMQTMVAEMVKKPEHEPRAYAVQPFMWSLGTIVGSAMGGFFAEPARYYPSVFSPDGLFGRFPYLLPNLMAAILIFIAIVQGYLLLEETNPKFLPQSLQDYDENSAVVTEQTPLQQGKRRMSAVDHLCIGNRRPSIISGATPSVVDPAFDIRRSSVGTIGSILIKPVAEHVEYSDVSSLQPTKAFTPSVILLILALLIFSYHQMASNTFFPIWLLDDPRTTNGLDLTGGFGYTVHDVGFFLSVNGVVALLIQAFVFPPFVEKVGVWKSAVFLTFFYPFTYAVTPFLSALPRAVLPAGIFMVLGLQIFCHILYFPCILILLKNATPSTRMLGKVNGLAMSAACGARTVAPPLGGLIYSAAGSAAAWWSCTAFAVIAIVELYWVPREKVEGFAVAERPARPSVTVERQNSALEEDV